MTRRKQDKARQHNDRYAEQLAEREYQKSQPLSAIGVAMAESILSAGGGNGFIRRMFNR